jgi:hypothetical protein
MRRGSQAATRFGTLIRSVVQCASYPVCALWLGIAGKGNTSSAGQQLCCLGKRHRDIQ